MNNTEWEVLNDSKLAEIKEEGWIFKTETNDLLALIATNLARLTDRIEDLSKNLEEIDRDLETLNRNTERE